MAVSEMEQATEPSRNASRCHMALLGSPASSVSLQWTGTDCSPCPGTVLGGGHWPGGDKHPHPLRGRLCDSRVGQATRKEREAPVEGMVCPKSH